jgi:hypothetical protein
MPNMQILRQNAGTIPTSQNPSTSAGVPADLQALVDATQPVVARFRDNSSPINVMNDQKTVGMGSTASYRIASTGLGERILHKVNGSISITATGAGSTKLANDFPYNLFTNVNIQINGNTSIASATPFSFILETARRNRLFPINPLNTSVCSVSASGTAGTVTLSKAGTLGTLCGYDTLTWTAAATVTLTYTFFFETPFVLNRDSLIGMLPLQNSSTFATVTYTTNSQLATSSTDYTAPLSQMTGATVTATALTGGTMNINSRYDFWAVPGDSALYQSLILNSFQLIEQPSNQINGTGSGALKLQFPLNSYLLSSMFINRSSTGQLVNTGSSFSNIYLQYNSNVQPFKSEVGLHQFAQYTDYGNPFDQFGTILWDGTDTTDTLNNADSAGWIDLYNTSNPQFIADVTTASPTPTTFSFVRAQIVPSDVRVIPM